MEKIKKYKGILIGIIIGGVLTGGIGVYATYNYMAGDITYTKNGTSITVASALNDIYSKLPETVTLEKSAFLDMVSRLEDVENTKTKEIRAGTINFNKIQGVSGSTKTITFSKAFANTNYSVAVTCTGGGDNWAMVEYDVYSKTTTGFTITAWNNAGSATGSSVTVDYIAVPYE